jgi:branched-chain amino acid transport system permease protein
MSDAPQQQPGADAPSIWGRLRILAGNDWAWLGLFVAVLVLVGPAPWNGGGNPFVVNVALTVMIFMVLSLGLNVVIGYTGLLDLGFASFMAIGAFTLSLGLVLTNQPEEQFRGDDALKISKLRLTHEQRQLDAEAGAPVVVRRRPDLYFDVLEGAPAVLAAKEAGDKRIEARHVSGLVLPVGQSTARGSHPLHFPGGFFLLLLCAGTVCAVAGLIRGYPTLKLTGDYYAIVTLGFAEIVWLVTLNEEWLTGGAFGIKLTKEFRPEIFGDALYEGTWQFYYITMGCVALATLASYHLQHSRLGRSWAAIKADETAAMASGIDIARAKMQAFAVSGFIGGVGGALWAIKVGTVTAKEFDIWKSILVVCCLVLGGMGTIRGALLGAAVLSGLGELLRLLSDPTMVARFLPVSIDTAEAISLPPEARFLVYGLILVLLMRFRPQGLLPPRASSPAPSADEQARLAEAESPLFALGQGKAA